MKNILCDIPESLDAEVFEDIVSSEGVRIERIISKGHASPEHGWYDQDENEWVVVLKGEGRLMFADGHEVTLTKGEHLNIPKNTRHKVIWTDPENITIWLAVFYT